MRRQAAEKPQNHERWIISYADFTTLLLATFVVMYAVSSVNSSKFQQMAEAFSTAFMGKVPTIQSAGLAAANKAPFDNMPSPVRTPVVTRDPQVKHLPPALRQQVERQVEKLNEAYEKLTRLLSVMISKGEVRVSLQSLGVVIDINAVVLFKSAKAELTPGALKLIEQVASVLKEMNYRIQVNGFTDNAQIHSAQFSSNWDLSAARAISVVKRFVLDGVDPSLLVGAGYGEYHPVASNDTPEGMAPTGASRSSWCRRWSAVIPTTPRSLATRRNAVPRRRTRGRNPTNPPARRRKILRPGRRDAAQQSTEPPAEHRGDGFESNAMRPFLLAGGLGLMWFALVQDSSVDGDAPAWGVAAVLAVRFLADFVGGWVVVSILWLVFVLGRLALSHLRAYRRQEI